MITLIWWKKYRLCFVKKWLQRKKIHNAIYWSDKCYAQKLAYLQTIIRNSVFRGWLNSPHGSTLLPLPYTYVLVFCSCFHLIFLPVEQKIKKLILLLYLIERYVGVGERQESWATRRVEPPPKNTISNNSLKIC